MTSQATSLRYWIAGTAVAFAGVLLARLVAPQLAGRMHSGVALAGQMVALAGLFILGLGVRRRLRQSAAADAPASTANSWPGQPTA